MASRVDETDRLPLIAGALRTAARRFGTPAYVMDAVSIERAGAELASAFPDPWVRQYSVKANDVTAIVARLAAAGLGANVVSRGEWAIARRAGVPNARITLEGVGKTDADLRAAVQAAAAGDQPLWIALESADEVAMLRTLAERAGLGRAGRPTLDVLYRLNPDVTPETQRVLAVGLGSSKFGMSDTELAEAVSNVGDRGPIRVRGIHVHVGSQLGAVDAWRAAVRRALALLALLRGGRPDFDTLDVGGGFPVFPIGQPAPDPARFARELPALLEEVPAERRPTRLAIEPGRYLVSRAGYLVASVLHARERGGRQVVVDAGMTELIRPALYGAHHVVVALTSGGQPLLRWDAAGPGAAPTRVEGPICESTDALGTHPLPTLRRGDLVAIRDAGAYAASLSSTYNGRPRPPQVILEPDGRLTLARRRGTAAALG